ncbi:MAG: hypothetical protein O2865_06385 [Planctomycetota bacterium]|nr:hypothetical protein [Planctomycetota bacterium]MDA0933303.1 hypothetical protein [Planctomycetota bacterium]
MRRCSQRGARTKRALLQPAAGPFVRLFDRHLGGEFDLDVVRHETVGLEVTGAHGGFTHRTGDRVRIHSPHLGCLDNTVRPVDDCPRWSVGLADLM